MSQLGHTTIGLHNEVDYVVTNPLLVAQHVDIKTIKYVGLGELWPQATALGQVDASLCWEGKRGEVIAQGIKLKYLRGSDFSKTPSNVYAIRTSDLKDAKRMDVYKRFLQGVIMGREFAAREHAGGGADHLQGAARPPGDDVPAGRLEAMAEQAASYAKHKGLWGYADLVEWQKYLDVVHMLGQTKKHFTTKDILTNKYIAEVNRKANDDEASGRREEVQARQLLRGREGPEVQLHRELRSAQAGRPELGRRPLHGCASS